MTLRDDVAKSLRCGEPMTCREIAIDIYGPSTMDEETFAWRMTEVSKVCRRLSMLGMAEMVGKTRQGTSYVKVWRWVGGAS